MKCSLILFPVSILIAWSANAIEPITYKISVSEILPDGSRVAMPNVKVGVEELVAWPHGEHTDFNSKKTDMSGNALIRSDRVYKLLERTQICAEIAEGHFCFPLAGNVQGWRPMAVQEALRGEQATSSYSCRAMTSVSVAHVQDVRVECVHN